MLGRKGAGSHKAAVMVIPQHPQKRGIRTSRVREGSVHSHVLPTILFTVRHAVLMVCRCVYFIVYWIAMRKMSQYIWIFFFWIILTRCCLNPWIVGADSSWLPVCGVGADRQTDIMLTSRLCCLQIGWDQTADLVWILKFNTISPLFTQTWEHTCVSMFWFNHFTSGVHLQLRRQRPEHLTCFMMSSICWVSPPYLKNECMLKSFS